MSEETQEDVDDALDGVDDVAGPAFGIATGAGALSLTTTAAGGGVLGSAAVAATIGAGATSSSGGGRGGGRRSRGMVLDHATDGASSGAAADGLMGLVGQAQSYKAAVAFDDGDVLEGLGHTAVGAGSTIAGAASSVTSGAANLAGDLWDGLTGD